jgi:hypothetical protein
MSRFKKLIEQYEESKEPSEKYTVKQDVRDLYKKDAYKKAEGGFKEYAEGPEWFKKIKKYFENDDK